MPLMETIAFNAWAVLLTVQGLLLVAAPLILKKVAEASIDHVLSRRLEAYKAELQTVTETVKFDFQRQLHDVSLFASKRHGVSADIYKAIREADGHIRGLFGLRRTSTFEEFNEADLRNAMTSLKVPTGQQDTILAVWRVDRPRGIRDLNQYLRLLEIIRAREAFHEAQNLTLINEIYLSEAVTSALDRVFSLLHGVLLHAEHPDPSAYEERLATAKNVGPAIDSVRTAMRSELARGYEGEARSVAVTLP
jgi:hypothetical protein